MNLVNTIIRFGLVIFPILVYIPAGLVVFILSLLGLKEPMTHVMYRVAQFWGRSSIRIVGCKITVSGRENIPRKGGVCFVSNHGSIFDILLVLAYIGRPFGFIAKKELSYIPFLNMWISLLGGFFIDRGNPRKALKTIENGVERIRAGNAMIIFPEGHRSRGRGLLPFHPGSLKLATRADAPIVPVAISGSYDVFERNYRVQSVPVSVTFCKPINTSDLKGGDRKQILSDTVYGIIKDALEASQA
ncbi:MAG: 1-acyl-sn-glycerol-3-phosphate acyltransferase [Treponema sp.]|jgi:1-acyl-sn-glycerol-3-phosphate acyltransferase|nr:1-acyl-sn-glycerol-3-phosphate acyltransferase [Treponema sp.]